MTLKTLPAAPEASPRAGISWDFSPKALESWNPAIRAAADDSDNVITIYDAIGEDFWTGEGVTTKRIAGALRRIGNQDVRVMINSPGGDVFEALGIYNLLREHPARVEVNIVGLAASAASFIAMAGDDIRIGRSSFLMVHNAWAIAMGNRHDMREIADWLEPFDAAIADIYAQRTGIDEAEIVKSMDDELWIGGKQAVEAGWADDFLASDQIAEAKNEHVTKVLAIRAVELSMAKQGIPRSQRRKYIDEIKSSARDATGGGTPSATATDTLEAVDIDVSPTRRIAFQL